MAITVKIGKTPGILSDVALNDGATVADALAVAGLSQESGWSLRVDGNQGNVGQTLRDGSIVLLAKDSKSA